MSSPCWNDLPTIPLQRVIQYLNLEDALSATSTCKNWRTALYMYECDRGPLELHVNDIRKSIFLCQVFKKKARRLHIHLEGTQYQMDIFTNIILPFFRHYSLPHLAEVTFIGPQYNEMKGLYRFGHANANVNLRGPMYESIIDVRKHTLQSIILLGCETTLEIDPCIQSNSEVHEDVNNRVGKPASQTSDNNRIPKPIGAPFDALQHVCMDYDVVTSLGLDGLTHLPNLNTLSLNLRNKHRISFKSLPWEVFRGTVQVILNIIAVPPDLFKDIQKNVLVENLPLAAFRAFFCHMIYHPVLNHLCNYYKDTLRELQWVDSHVAETCKLPKQVCPTISDTETSYIHPLILICWQCPQLQKLVIHGYWVWQYDILGMVKLRHNTLQHLEISATYFKRRQHGNTKQKEVLCPVYCGEKEDTRLDKLYVQQMTELLKFSWTPTKWYLLHPALLRGTPASRFQYALNEIGKAIDFT